MARKINNRISLCTILFFIGCIGVFVSIAFPVKEIKNEATINIINSSSQLAIALSEYGSSQTDSPEQLKALERAKEHLAIRLEDKSVRSFGDETEELQKENALQFLNLALSDISGFYGFTYVEMKNANMIKEYAKLINNASKNLNILNLLKLNFFVAKQNISFTKRTIEKASFHSWLLLGTLLSALMTFGAVFLFMFRRVGVIFMTTGFLCSLLIAAFLFMILFSQDAAFNNLGVMLNTPSGEFGIGAVISILAVLFLFVGAMVGINGSNWLIALVFYLIIILSFVVLYFYFTGSFASSPTITSNDFVTNYFIKV